jgi:hypothetical protein
VNALFAIRTVHRRDAVLIAVGTIALAGYAIAGSAPVGLATCGILAAIGVYFFASAMKWSGLRAGATEPI